MNYWFVSDYHLGHKNIIRYCNRPFSSVEEMDATIINNHNALVKPDDEVFFLGDFALTGNLGARKVLDYLDMFNGKFNFIAGNHDKYYQKEIRSSPKVISYKSYFEWSTKYVRDKIGTSIVMSHYPIEDWAGKYHGFIHLHGHCHGLKNLIQGRLEVSVECTGYKPVPLEELVAKSRHVGVLVKS